MYTYAYLNKSVFFFQGHSRSGEIQDYHNSLLQGSHGEFQPVQLDVFALSSSEVKFMHNYNKKNKKKSLKLFYWLLIFFLICTGNLSLMLCPHCTLQGIMLVYDITNEKSFDNIKNWIRNIEEVQYFAPAGASLTLILSKQVAG